MPLRSHGCDPEKIPCRSGLITLAVNFVAGVLALMYLICGIRSNWFTAIPSRFPAEPLRLNLCGGPIYGISTRCHPACDRTQDPASLGDEAVHGCRGGLSCGAPSHTRVIAPVRWQDQGDP